MPFRRCVLVLSVLASVWLASVPATAAGPGAPTVLVAPLDGDTTDLAHTARLERLLTEIVGAGDPQPVIGVRRASRALPAASLDNPLQIEQRQAAGEALLQEAGGDVVLHGHVDLTGRRLHLYVLARGGPTRSIGRAHRFAPLVVAPLDLERPWGHIVAAQVVAQLADGHYVRTAERGDTLADGRSVIRRRAEAIGNLLDWLVPQPANRDLEASQLLAAHGAALVSLVANAKAPRPLRGSGIASILTAVRITERLGQPIEHAVVTSLLGEVLVIRGQERTDSSYADAIEAHQSALAIVDAAAAPQLWASVQLRLAEAFGLAGRHQDGAKAARAALTVRTRDASPRAWASAQYRLGQALSEMSADAGVPNEKTELRTQSIAAFRAALSVWRADASAWVRLDTQRLLASELTESPGTADFNEGIALYRDILSTLQGMARPPSETIAVHAGLAIALNKQAEAERRCDLFAEARRHADTAAKLAEAEEPEFRVLAELAKDIVDIKTAALEACK